MSSDKEQKIMTANDFNRQVQQEIKDAYSRLEALWKTADQECWKGKYVMAIYEYIGHSIVIYKIPVPSFCKTFTMKDCVPNMITIDPPDPDTFYQKLRERIQKMTDLAGTYHSFMSIRPEETAYLLFCSLTSGYHVFEPFVYPFPKS